MIRHRLSLLVWLLLAGVLSACGTQAAPTASPPTAAAPAAATSAPVSPTVGVPTQTPGVSGSPTAAPATAGGPAPELSTARNSWFAASGLCVLCHTDNRDATGKDVTNSRAWRATMMANAAVDPYYLAGVSGEIATHPEYREAIEAKCSTCHMPMAHFSDQAQGQAPRIFEEGYLDPNHPLHALAHEGVSCTVCHQIQPDGLGQRFSGDLPLDFTTPQGQRAIFGPFVPNRAGERMMPRLSGFMPVQGDHMGSAELCAVCHNLATHYVTADGSLSEETFPEQMPYSEWLISDYAPDTSCQDCHMPLAEGGVVLANIGPPTARSPYYQHEFTGGNVYMLTVLQTFGQEIGALDASEGFAAAVARTQTMLTERTARLTLSDPQWEDGTLRFQVHVQVLTGHKFPTGYPSRRAWLHVTVRDAQGKVVFESGAYTPEGAIQGNANDADPQAYEPHYEVITQADQVQIYEPILQDVRGQVTTVLLDAAAYVKDNRLLPAGFDKTAAPPEVAPAGAALEDEDFVGGGDTVTYRLDLGDATGPFTVEAELLYQSIGYRWATHTGAYPTEWAQAFQRYNQAVPNLPVVVARASAGP